MSYAVYSNDSPAWRRLRAKIIKRDSRLCQACESPFNRDRLTVHHIIPRDEGGDDLPHNLITLCPSCHNAIELNYKHYNTAQRIRGCFVILDIPKEEGHDEHDWHSWVYGGAKNPYKSVLTMPALVRDHKTLA